MKHHVVGGRLRIGVSLLLAVFIVSGTYLYRGSATASTDLEDPRAFVAALPLREYQETKDSDGDGLRDWLEELSGTDPLVNDALKNASSTVNNGTSTPFVPKTETEKFSVAFFEDILKTHGGKNLTPEEKQAIITTSVGRAASLNVDRIYTRSDITIVDDRSEEAVRAYGNDAALPIIVGGSNPKGLKSEIVLLGSALQADDPTYLKDLPEIRKGYEKMLADSLKVTVPEPIINEHLALVNALQAMVDNIAGFEKVFDDPLVGYLRFKRYLNDVQGLGAALQGIQTKLERAHVVYAKDEAGGFFFTLTPAPTPQPSPR